MYYLLELGGGDGCGMTVGGRAVAGIVRVVYWGCAGGADGAGGWCIRGGREMHGRRVAFLSQGDAFRYRLQMGIRKNAIFSAFGAFC